MPCIGIIALAHYSRRLTNRLRRRVKVSKQLRDSISHLRKLNEVPERPRENVLVSGINSAVV